jgi:multicomponent Na+:H+ antiporter subunit G
VPSALISLLSDILLIAGSMFVIVGAVGIVRMPDFFTRLHAASVIETGGLFLLVLGMVLRSGISLASIKLIFIALFIFFASPAATHAMVRSGLKSGLKPMTLISSKEVHGKPD